MKHVLCVYVVMQGISHITKHVLDTLTIKVHEYERKDCVKVELERVEGEKTVKRKTVE